MAAILDELDRPSGGSGLALTRHVDQDAVCNAAELRPSDANQRVRIESRDQHILQADVIGATDLHEHARRTLFWNECNSGCRSHPTNDDISLCAVQAQAALHRIKAASDAHQTATVSQGVDRLLNVGELSM